MGPLCYYYFPAIENFMGVWLILKSFPLKGALDIVQQIKSIFHTNLSLGDTSTKFGTNDVQDVLFKKSMLSSWKSKMVANFQDGHLVKCKNMVFKVELEWTEMC